MRETTDHRPPTTDHGLVEAIYVAGIARGAMRAVDVATALAGRGLEGDRYALGAGTFSDWPKDHELTLIEAEVLEEVAERHGLRLAPGETRRNVTTRNVRLNDLVGKRFCLGPVVCEGTRLCDPCAHLEVVTGYFGLCRLIAGRGGLRARILAGGVFGVGDAVLVV